MVINQAKGDTERFNQIYAAYAAAPDITKKRLYLEQMQKIYSRAKKATIVDESIKGLIPIFGSAPGKGQTLEGQP
jgi:membrane protease subunit HflK